MQGEPHNAAIRFLFKPIIQQSLTVVIHERYIPEGLDIIVVDIDGIGRDVAYSVGRICLKIREEDFPIPRNLNLRLLPAAVERVIHPIVKHLSCLGRENLEIVLKHAKKLAVGGLAIASDRVPIFKRLVPCAEERCELKEYSFLYDGRGAIYDPSQGLRATFR